jgi:flagellar motility protein MotE (MotC chaperone)
MLGKIRLLPLMILLAGLVFTLRVVDLVVGPTDVTGPVSVAVAASDDNEPDQPIRVAQGSDENDKKDDNGEDRETEPQLFTRAEVTMLQNLQSRREELDVRENEIKLQEDMMRVAQKRIDEKIEQLKGIEATIQELLKKHDKQEEKKIQRLVKMYESMKPKDAARIFQSLDMPILISVVERMKERKVAPILASMPSKGAKKLTTELATRKQLPKTGASAPSN